MKASLIVCSKNQQAVKNLKLNVCEHLPSVFEFVPILNASSIARGYNAGAKKAEGDILVFCHDDIKIRFDKLTWDEFVDNLTDRDSGIGGVAGFRKVAFDGHWPPPGGFGSGGCLHGSEGHVWYTTFGLFGRTLTLDGIFLAMRREVFNDLEGFDTEYPGWHWYDTDITFRSHLAGYRNFTYPLLIEHGINNYTKDGYCVDQKEFNLHANIFWKKYSGYLPQVVDCDNQELEDRVFSRENRWGQVVNQ